MKNKKHMFIYVALLAAGVIIGRMIFGGNSTNPDRVSNPVRVIASTWTCSMHPQIRQNKPGKCSICGMDLVPLNIAGDEDTASNQIQMSESAMKIAEVQTTVVEKTTPVKEIRLTGKIGHDERRISVIASRFKGRVEKLFVNYTGQKVSVGEKLAVIYSPELVTAQKEFFEAMKLKMSNPEYYQSSKNKLRLWSITDSQINEIEAGGEPVYYFNVLSPSMGIVMKRIVSVGDYVGEGSVLFEMVDHMRVWALFDAYESDIPWINENAQIHFEVQSLPGKTFSGTVTFIDPVINPETRVAQVRTEVDNPGELLKPGMFASGILKTKLRFAGNALVIPKSSVLWTGKKAVVYVKVPGKSMPVFEYREITLGEDAGNFYVVKEGLYEGEEVVTHGVFKVDAAAQLAGKRSMMNVGDVLQKE